MKNDDIGKGNMYVEGGYLGDETTVRAFITGEHHHDFKAHVSKYMCGFLNSSQKGTLYIGVKDNGTVVGMECDHEQEDKIRRIIDETFKGIQPSIFSQNYHVEFVPILNRDGAIKCNYKVIEITVEKVDNLTQPYKTAGKVYIRRDVCLLGPLKPSEIQEWSKHAIQAHKLTISSHDEPAAVPEDTYKSYDPFGVKHAINTRYKARLEKLEQGRDKRERGSSKPKIAARPNWLNLENENLKPPAGKRQTRKRRQRTRDWRKRNQGNVNEEV